MAWVDGGTTERANARIAHRYCNWEAGQTLARERGKQRIEIRDVIEVDLI
jgi:hypothetical protein